MEDPSLAPSRGGPATPLFTAPEKAQGTPATPTQAEVNSESPSAHETSAEVKD